MRWTHVAGAVLAGGAAVVALVASSASCSQTPVNIPVRTFQQPQKMDYLCMQVNDPNGNPLPAVLPAAADQCAPVGQYDFNPAALPYHLFAVVTQTQPGQLGVVDLTGGWVVDEDNSTPGINMIPVGALPTDVAVSPDGAMTFVTSADVAKPAIYGIDDRRLLGSSAGIPAGAPLKVTDLPSCSLPQAPDGLVIVPTAKKGYVLVAMLRQWGGEAPVLVAVDPGPLLRGAHVPGGGTGPVAAPGSLTPCKILGSSGFSTNLPASWMPGPTWPDGVPYVDGGVVVPPDAEPPLAPGELCTAGDAGPTGGDAGIPLALGPETPEARPRAMVLRTDKPLLYVSDGALPVIHVFDVSSPAKPAEQAPLLATSLLAPTKQVTVGALAISPPTRDYERYLYAVDTSDGTLMVFDVTDPASSQRTPLQRPHPELNPFSPPDRVSFSAPVATVAFVEHDWLLPSQADVYHYYSGILCNPNPNAHPNATTFDGKGAYYRADQAGLIQTNGVVESLPGRLRGIFGFVTLTDGSIVPIDVDDWDAPCRRPDPMAGTDAGAGAATDGGVNPLVYGMTGVLDVAEPQPSGPKDLDEYHVPIAYNGAIPESPAVTLEAFFPVSAPHRPRSQFLLLNDPSSGEHIPFISVLPELFDVNGTPLQVGQGAMEPLLLPTAIQGSGFVDPGAVSNPIEPNPANRSSAVPADAGAAGVVPGVRVSFDDPTADIAQNWTVTYEGVLPGAQAIATDIVSTDGYRSLTLTTGSSAPEAGAPANGVEAPGYCALGIEDWTIGQARAAQATSEMSRLGVAQPPDLAQWTADYVELGDDVLQQGDQYWSEPASENRCWAGLGGGLDDDRDENAAADARFNACNAAFGENGGETGATGMGTIADQYLQRDLPILHAYADHLVVGRFGYASPEQTNNRVVVGPDPSNVPFLKFTDCCFHHQATFKVRAGGEWITVGSNNGLLNHIQPDPATGACVPSCNSNDVLLNARAFDVPWWDPTKPGCVAKTGPNGNPVTSDSSDGVERNSPLAMRNPMFSFVMWSACGHLPAGVHTLSARDSTWTFSMQGGFTPWSIALNENQAIAVSPQSMRFVEPLGQLAVVDAEQQGLVLIDLNTLAFAHNPYY